MGGLIGLDYTSLGVVAQALAIELDSITLRRVQVLEREVIRVVKEREK
jgi:hypothetical protein